MIAGRVAAGALLALLMPACASGDPSTAVAPSTTPKTTLTTPAPTTSAPTSAPSCTPAFPANTDVDVDESAGGILGLRAATSGVHAGYDRVVFTLGGSAEPSWRVEYDAAPSSDGSGDPVVVQGDKALLVFLGDVGYPDDTGVPEPAVKRFTPTGTKVVKEVVLDGVYEGQYTAFIGVDATRPFRVFRLAGPPRVVVDVRHC